MSIQLPLPFPPDEQWEDIPGYEGRYQVSSLGQVKRLIDMRRWKAGGLLRPQKLNGRYLMVSLSRDGSNKKLLVHRLVMLAFVGRCPDGMNVNHKNGIKTDNQLGNLEYCTYKENSQHAVLVLKRHIGIANRLSKLNDDKVREIRYLYHSTKTSYRRLARQFGVGTTAIQQIIERKTWKHVKD